MTSTFDPTVERDANMWPLLAAGILGIQGLSKLVFAAFLPAPLTSAGIDVPVLGTVPFVWISFGILALVAGAAVAARLTWGRYLGMVTAVMAIAAGLYDAQGISTGALAFILPGITLFALWQKWPTHGAIRGADVVERPSPGAAATTASPDQLRARPKDRAA